MSWAGAARVGRPWVPLVAGGPEHGGARPDRLAVARRPHDRARRTRRTGACRDAGAVHRTFVRADLACSLAEGSSALAPARLTAMAERRSPRDATFVVTGTDSRALGGVLIVQRGPRSVFETLRCMVALPEAIDDLHVVRDGLEAGLRSAMLGRRPRSAQFSTSRGRLDGVVDRASRAAGPTRGVLRSARDARPWLGGRGREPSAAIRSGWVRLRESSSGSTARNGNVGPTLRRWSAGPA